MMPGINDAPGQIEEILALAAEAGAGHVGGIGLHLRGGVREVFFDWLRAHRPDLVERYERLYARGAYLPRAEQERLARRRARQAPAASHGQAGRMPGAVRGVEAAGRRRRGAARPTREVSARNRCSDSPRSREQVRLRTHVSGRGKDHRRTGPAAKPTSASGRVGTRTMLRRKRNRDGPAQRALRPGAMPRAMFQTKSHSWQEVGLARQISQRAARRAWRQLVLLVPALVGGAARLPLPRAALRPGHADPRGHRRRAGDPGLGVRARRRPRRRARRCSGAWTRAPPAPSAS